MKFATDPKRDFIRYSDAVAQALATAVLAVREPDQEARIYCRDADEIRLVLGVVMDACDALNILNMAKSEKEILRTGRIVLEMRNGSAIIICLEGREP